jgi:hypothetical protein
MRRIGALRPARLNQAPLLQPAQQQIEDHPLLACRGQPVPELAQHAEIKPVIS